MRVNAVIKKALQGKPLARLLLNEDQMGNFRDGDIVSILVSRSAWYEMVNWLDLLHVYYALPTRIKQKIADAGMPHP